MKLEYHSAMSPHYQHLNQYVTHNTQKRKEQRRNPQRRNPQNKPTLSPYHPHPYQNTFKPSHPHTIGGRGLSSVAEDSRLHSIAVWGYRGFHFQAIHSDPQYSLSLSLSFSPSLNAVVWIKKNYNFFVLRVLIFYVDIKNERKHNGFLFLELSLELTHGQRLSWFWNPLVLQYLPHVLIYYYELDD